MEFHQALRNIGNGLFECSNCGTQGVPSDLQMDICLRPNNIATNQVKKKTCKSCGSTRIRNAKHDSGEVIYTCTACGFWEGVNMEQLEKTRENLEGAVKAVLGEKIFSAMINHLGFVTTLEAAGKKCFVEDYHGEDVELIRAALKELSTGQFINFK
jgi:ribosomal protein L37AE/L43A